MATETYLADPGQWRRLSDGLLVPYEPGEDPTFIMGSSIDFPESLASLEANSGATLDAVRLYNGGVLTSWPSGWAAHAGHRATVVSWKPDLAALAAGNATARNGVLGVLDTIPEDHDTYLCIAHEPENGEYTTTQQKTDYRNGWAWFGDQVHALGNPRVKSMWIMMAYSWNLSSGRNPLDWYPGDAYVDVIACDTYNEGSLNSTQRWDSWGLDLGVPQPGESLAPKGGGYNLGGFIPWAEGKGKPWFIGEWGTIQNHNAPTPAWASNLGVAATKPEWIRHGVDWFAQWDHYLGMTLFNSTGRNRSGESWILSNGAPQTYAAWGEKVNQYRRGDLV